MMTWRQGSDTRPLVPKRGTAWDKTLITGYSGFLNGTHVASNLGWRRVETLSVGDSVLTFDHGMKRIVDIQHEVYLAPEHILPKDQQPIRFCQGAFNTRADVWMMPDQGILVECDTAADAVGDPFAVIPAGMMVGLPGVVDCTPLDHLDVITLAFEEDEVVYVDGGLLAYCPRPRRILLDSAHPGEGLYDVLDPINAHCLVQDLMAQMTGGPLVCEPPEDHLLFNPG
ncbi:MAG: Hint domain-containing protein [Sedimentitalea sp.]